MRIIELIDSDVPLCAFTATFVSSFFSIVSASSLSSFNVNISDFCDNWVLDVDGSNCLEVDGSPSEKIIQYFFIDFYVSCTKVKNHIF